MMTVKNYQVKKTDLRIIDNGTFLTGLFSARNQIVIKARNARLHEGQKDVEAAISEWSEVSLLINDVETKYFDSSKITWATKQSFLRFGISFFCRNNYWNYKQCYCLVYY